MCEHIGWPISSDALAKSYNLAYILYLILILWHNFLATYSTACANYNDMIYLVMVIDLLLGH